MARNQNRIQTFFLGFHDPSGATGPLFGADDVADDDLGREIFGVAGIVRRVKLHVVETQSAHDEVVTLKWRPTPGSATGELTLGVYTVPASIAAGTYAIADLNRNPNDTETTIDAASETGVGGIGGSSSVAGGVDTIFGPGGEFELEDAGSSTAGQYNVYLEVEVMNDEAGDQAITYLTAEGGTGN